MSLYRRLSEEEPDVKRCMSCGSCSATCVSSGFSSMSVRKMILALQRGMDIKDMLSNCMLCGKCSIVCPRGINTRHLILLACRYYQEGNK